MGVVAFGSVRSCGVTTLALVVGCHLAAGAAGAAGRARPGGRDAGRGVGVAGRAEPGVAGRGGPTGRRPEPGVGALPQLPGGAAVLAGPSSADHARSALGMLDRLLGRLGELDADVLVDCGRLDPGSAALGLWERADRVVLAVRPRLADLHALATGSKRRPSDGRRLGLVTVGDGPYPDTEIAEALGFERVGPPAVGPRRGQALVSVPASSRELRLAPLVRAARTLADRLATELSDTALAGTALTDTATRPSLRARKGAGGGLGSLRSAGAAALAARSEGAFDERERTRGGVRGDRRHCAGGRAALRGPRRAVGPRAGTGGRRSAATRPARTSRRLGAS